MSRDDYESAFWSETERYHDLAREYERNIEVTHPDFVTSDGVTSPYEYWCSWCASSVVYYEYRGPSV